MSYQHLSIIVTCRVGLIVVKDRLFHARWLSVRRDGVNVCIWLSARVSGTLFVDVHLDALIVLLNCKSDFDYYK